MAELIKSISYDQGEIIRNILRLHRLVADWQLKKQRSARKFHCYFWVFQKCSIKINYTEVST